MQPSRDASYAAAEAPGRRSVYDLRFQELERMMAADAVSPAHTRTLWRALHREDTVPFDQRRDFTRPLQRWIERAFSSSGSLSAAMPQPVTDIASADGLTRKFLLRLADGQTIETVLMGYTGRFTACISTQAGCAMGCVFCATGQMGFSRHLAPGEIVAQVLHARRTLTLAGKGGLRNIVLMGMGEPLHNYDAVMVALETIADTRGINIGPSRITISTVGVVLRMAGEQRAFRLAVSLHGTTDDERNALVPAGRRWPLAELIGACRKYCGQTGNRIFFEWTLIAGTNDSTDHAQRLATLLSGIDAHVNLIPLNPTGGYAGTAASAAAAVAFQRVLKAAGLPSTVRQRRGIDVAAGCGQLKSDKARAAL
jgi:23S rRNA (adenine2503-C2)-methyltransferase